MHLLIPFAGVLSPAGRLAASHRVLPQLQGLLQCLTAPAPAQRDEASEWSLSPPHERALARARGLPGSDGQWPWAALQAQADGIQTAGRNWGLVTPVHWHVGTDQVSLIDPAQLMLDAAGSRQLFEAVEPLFTSEGFEMHFGAPSRWFAAHAMLSDMPCASLDRVIGRNVDRWLGTSVQRPGAALVRRLQAEVQMLLYTHPLNDERQARGLLPVNSFWLSGCGPAPEQTAGAATAAAPVVDARLRDPALAENWPAWVKAWQTLDEGPLAELHRAARDGQVVQITLCGERAAQTLTSGAAGWLQRLRRRLGSPAVHPLLETL
jgi:hypothetical protein